MEGKQTIGYVRGVRANIYTAYLDGDSETDGIILFEEGSSSLDESSSIFAGLSTGRNTGILNMRAYVILESSTRPLGFSRYTSK